MRRTWAKLALVAIVALGVGAALSLRWGAGALEAACDAQLVSEGAPDLTVSFPYGLAEEDVAALEAAQGVRAAELADNNHIYVWCDDPAPTFSAAYEQQVRSVAERVREIGEPRAAERYAAELAELKRLIAEAEDNLANRQAALEQARESSAGGEARIEEREAELVAAREALATATSALSSVKERYLRERTEAEKKLEEPKKAVDEAQKAADEAKKQLEEATKKNAEKAKLEELQKAADEAQKKLDEKKKPYDEDKKAFDEMVAAFERQVSSAEAEVSYARSLVEERDKAVSAERAGLDTGRRKVRENEIATNAAQFLLDSRNAKLETWFEAPWVVTSHLEEPNVRQVAQAAQWLRLAALALVPAALVALACARGVGELGLREAALWGVAGVAGGCGLATVGEKVVAQAWAEVLGLGVGGRPVVATELARDVAVVVASALAVVVLAHLAARPAQAAARLVGRRYRHWAGADEVAETHGAEENAPARASWGLTLAGIVALLLFAWVVGTATEHALERQFGELYAFDATASVKAGDDVAAGVAAQQLEDAGCRVAAIHAFATEANGEAVTVVAPLDVDWFLDLYRLEPTEGESPDLEQAGAWVALGPGATLSANPGDTLQVRGSKGETREVVVRGTVARAMPGTELVMGEEAYREAFGVDPAVNRLLVDTRGQATEELPVALTDEAEQAQAALAGYESTLGLLAKAIAALALLCLL